MGKWVTRSQMRVNRTATCWLIKRFLDPNAEFIFVNPEEVANVQATQGAIGFDAPGATYPHQDKNGNCSFVALVHEKLPDNKVLLELAAVVQAADIPSQIDLHPAAAGLKLISQGFPTVSQGQDLVTVEKASYLYDSIYEAIAADQASKASAEPIQNDKEAIPKIADTSLLKLESKLAQGGIHPLEVTAQFYPRHFIRRRIFSTESMHFNIYCMEPGQSNPLHKHSQSDEICYFVKGYGEMVVGEELVPVKTGDTVLVPKDVGHEIRNTGYGRMIVVLAQSPLPCAHEKVETVPKEVRVQL